MIKVLLLVSFAGVALAAARLGPSPRHLLLRRAAVVASFVAVGVAVLFPDMVTALANLVGVGRGTDLVLYALVVVSVAVWLGVYRRIVDMESRIAHLVRAQALAVADAEGQRPVDALGESRPPTQATPVGRGRQP